jgi:prepilin-type N-terminal cleavage/methylation domain-containing protein
MISPTNLEAHEQVRRRAFTLVEILMVLAILGIITLVTMPSIVKSIRGNRLRVAANTVVRAGRYARSMAILGNREMVLSFDISTATINVSPGHTASPPTAPTPSTSRTPTPDLVPQESASPAPPQNSPSFNITRQLDAVRIESVELEHKDNRGSKTLAVLYRSNGRCIPYEVKLVDEFGAAMRITVDALSSAEAKREDN